MFSLFSHADQKSGEKITCYPKKTDKIENDEIRERTKTKDVATTVRKVKIKILGTYG